MVNQAALDMSGSGCCSPGHDLGSRRVLSDASLVRHGRRSCHLGVLWQMLEGPRSLVRLRDDLLPLLAQLLSELTCHLVVIAAA